MKNELKYTLRISEHVKQVTATHFILGGPFISQIIDYDDAETFRSYTRDLVVERPNYSGLTSEQRYLHDLGSIIGPVIAAYRARTRIPRQQPRTGKVRASSQLEDLAQRLAMEAYHFKERVSLFSSSACSVILCTETRARLSKSIGGIIRKYNQTNSRLLAHRNFVVHGPRRRYDEFAQLRSWELGGLLLHSDLWADYNTEFDMARAEWTLIAKTLIASMEIVCGEIQLLNENNLEHMSFYNRNNHHSKLTRCSSEL